MAKRQKTQEAQIATEEELENTAGEESEEIIEAPAEEVNPPGRGDPFFEIVEKEGVWYWMFWSAQGRPWATCVRPFSKKIHCTNNIRAVQEEMATREIPILQATK